jgi:CheY-like chemotaxis protein
MPKTPTPPPILVCDENPHSRRLVAEVLSGGGFSKLHFASDGLDLLKSTMLVKPRIVITSSRIPGISGLHFTRMVRDGHETIDRALSIIVMTNTPTQGFVEAAQESGADELLCRPFTGAALLARVEAVLLRPRRFIDSVVYVGPCRRRRMLEEYGGPLRRYSDPFEHENRPLWEAEGNRALVRQCLGAIGALAGPVAPGDRRQMRALYEAVREAEELADEICDQALGEATRSLGRYLSDSGAADGVEKDVLDAHIEVLQRLARLGQQQQDEREALVRDLGAAVDACRAKQRDRTHAA